MVGLSEFLGFFTICITSKVVKMDLFTWFDQNKYIYPRSKSDSAASLLIFLVDVATLGECDAADTAGGVVTASKEEVESLKPPESAATPLTGAPSAPLPLPEAAGDDRKGKKEEERELKRTAEVCQIGI
jgi:hypothetical protein